MFAEERSWQAGFAERIPPPDLTGLLGCLGACLGACSGAWVFALGACLGVPLLGCLGAGPLLANPSGKSSP